MKTTISRGREIKIFLFFSLLSLLSFSQNDYYYNYSQQIPILLNKQVIEVIVEVNFDETQLNNLNLSSYNFQTNTNPISGTLQKTSRLEFLNTITDYATYEQKIDSLKQLNGVKKVYPHYFKNDSDIWIDDRFLVKLNNVSDTTHLQNISLQKNTTIISEVPHMPLWYLLCTGNNLTNNALELSAQFFETSLFASSQPNFFQSASRSENNSQSETIENSSLEICYSEGGIEISQWNLFNNPNGNELADINVCEAWIETKGIGARVAVFDTGVENNLIDLPASYPGNVYKASEAPFPQNWYYTVNGYPSHGTNVAGIIGALHNSSIAGGISPQATVYHVAMELSSFSEMDVISGLNQVVYGVNAVDVINFSNGVLENSFEFLDDALTDALTEGRDLKGAIIVAAVGNDPNVPVSYPANFPGVIGVGGSTIDGNWNSETTDDDISPTTPIKLDISAPSQFIPTTDFNNNTVSFGLTSAAAPHVSGIATLMVSANFQIKGMAINNIIGRTAQKSGATPYNAFENLSIGSWNNKLGYGIPNATACVLTAKEFETTFGVLDVHMRNSLKDFGKEPDNVTKHANFVLWNSPDIWIPENTGNEFYEHRNPIYSGPGSTETVLVRVINKSNETVPINSLNVKLYWSKTVEHTNTWPENWDGTITYNGIPVGGPVGNPNGQYNTLSSIEPGEQGIYFFTWDVPNPDDFVGYMNSDPNEFSFLARIDSNDDPMTNEVMVNGNVWTNTRNNNNIVWKNVVVIEPIPGPAPMTGTINITNSDSVTKSYSLEFGVDWEEIGKLIYEEAEVTLQMDNELYQNWSNNGSLVSNATENSQKFLINDDQVVFDNISLDPGETRNITLTFNFLVDELTNKKNYYYHFTQRDIYTDDIVYGKTFLIKKGESSTFDANAGNDQEIDKNESVTLSAESISEPATYNWYDPQGNLIFTGQDISVSPELTQQYTLEVINNSNGVKDYDNVTVTVNPFVLGVIAPNPAQSQITIDYIAEDATSAYLMLTEISSNNTFNHILNTQVGQHQIDVSSYATGIYLVTLVCNGTAIETKTIIIE